MEIWIDGQLAGKVECKERFRYDTGRMQTLIGAINNGTSQFFLGTILKAQLYNRALSADEISQLK
jgi:hypothetical protein